MKKPTKKDWWWRNENGLPFTYNGKVATAKDWVSCPCLGLVPCKPTDKLFFGLRYRGRQIWNGGLERAVFAYELARRANRILQLPVFPKLTRCEQEHIEGMLGDSELRTYAYVKDTPPPHSPPKPGFSDGGWHWNLREGNALLAKEFLQWIRNQRAKHGIPEPKPRARTHNRKKVQWHHLELMDKAANREIAEPRFDYGESERSENSRLERDAKQRMKELQDALRVIAQNPDAFFTRNPEKFPNLIRCL